MEHRHIHGGNLRFSAKAYLEVGGFAALPCHEDVDLVKRFESQGYSISRSKIVNAYKLSF